MKILHHALLITLLAGCASAPSPLIRQAARGYQSVNRSMNREDVYRILGEPQAKLPDGRERWRVTDKRDTAELLLRFGPAGEITEMEQHYPMVSD